MPTTPAARPHRAVRAPADPSSRVDVSVCIANRDCQDLLRACLHSLQPELQQVRLEIIVVDNASADGAAAMVAREFPKVRLCRSAVNLGFARANNLAASLSQGRHLFFLNNDTEVPPGTLRRLVAYTDEHPEVGLIGPRLRDGGGRVQVSWRPRPTLATLLNRTGLVRWTGLFQRRYRRYRRASFDAQRTRRVDLLMGAALLMRRRTFEECGRWDEDFTFGGEDLELCHRVGQKYDLVYHAGAEVIHHGRACTRRHPEYASPHTAAGFVRYLRKSGSRCLPLLAYRLAVTADAPFQLAAKGSKGLWQRLCGRKVEADRNFWAARAAWYFLTRGLVAFWTV